MTSLTNHISATSIKALIIGNSGSGKTGALESLARAGFKLRIIDADNGLDILANAFDRDNAEDVKLLSNIEFVTCTDKKGWKAGKLNPAIKPEAWKKAMDALTTWPDSGESPSTWDSSYVLVIDSLSMLGRHAMNHVLSANQRLGDNPTQPEWGTAQRLLENMISLLYSDEIKCNVLVMTHVQVVTLEDGSVRWLPNALGQALAPILPRYFNNMLYVSVKKNIRSLHTQPLGLVDVKVSRPNAVKDSYILTDDGKAKPGLAQFFSDMGIKP